MDNLYSTALLTQGKGEEETKKNLAGMLPGGVAEGVSVGTGVALRVGELVWEGEAEVVGVPVAVCSGEAQWCPL